MKTLHELQSLIVAALAKESEEIRSTHPVNLYEPVAYSLEMGGKRLRPVMVLMAYNLFRNDVHKALPVALCIEVFHNFTLLHDDIMDRAELRRNRPAVHTKYGQNTAILSGDAMSIMAYRYLLQSEAENIRELAALFTQTALEVCEGQQFDMDFESRTDVSISEYLNMIRLKTAVLLACSLKAGALAAGAPLQKADLLYVFGIDLGMAFQIQDDLLDVFADQEKFGKRTGGDIVTNKKTFLLLKALELARGTTRAELTGWLSRTEFKEDEKVQAVKAIYSELDIPALAMEQVRLFHESALDALSAMQLNNEQNKVLLELVNTVMLRDH